MQGLVVDYIDRFVNTIFRTSITRANQFETGTASGPAIVPVDSVTEFWARADQLLSGDICVSVRGSLSTLAPAMLGVPKRKRELHLATRRSIEDIKEKLTRQGHVVGPTTLDALLAFTAGQMVIRPAQANVPYVYMGLYHSIVRNSIPLFVERSYFEKSVAPMFGADGNSPVVEAAVVARPARITGEYFRAFLEDFGIYQIYNPQLIEELLPRCILQVDGSDGHSYIRHVGSSRYLDGDIWVAVRTGDADRVVSRFLDLSDPSDLHAERVALKRDVEKYYAGDEIISEYDQEGRLFEKPQIVESSAILNSLYKELAPKPSGQP